ncbi:MAG: hypothetical protein KGZ39_08070 [Simkania sp.]|nr:hypothetical protein [Simkania sp.]
MDKIDRCGLIPAIGQYGGLQLKEREISLRKENVQISIYDEKLQAILKRLENENHKDTDRDLPYFYGAEGIIEFNRYLHGSDIDLNSPDYYKHLPKTNIFLSTEEMQKSVPDPIQEGEWVIIMKAGRRHPNVGVRETHSWIEVYSPTQEGLYELLMSVGLWQKKVPESNWEYFKITMGAIPGCLAIFEHRSFDRLQQVRAEGFNISPEAGFEFVGRKIRTAFIDAKNGHLPFQICDHNCLKFAADFTRSAVGEERFNSRITEDQLTRSLFTIDHEPSAQKILSTIQNFPSYLSTFAYWLLKTSTGQYQRFTIRERDGQLRQISIAHDSLFGRTGRLYLPSHFIASK